MRKIGFIALIALAIVASASCHRRPLHDMEERVQLKVVIDVDTVCNVGRNIYNDKLAKPNTNTDMLRMFFYNSADHSYFGETLLSDKSYDEAGHQVFTSYLNIPSGTFDFVVYNFDTPNTLIKNTNNEGTIEAYTQQVPQSVVSTITGKAGGNDAMMLSYQPDHLMVAREQNCYIPFHTELESIETVAHTCLNTYYIQIHVEGLRFVQTATAVISGLYSANMFGRDAVSPWTVGERVGSPSTAVYFNMEKSTDEKMAGENKDVLCALFNTFGKIEDVSSDLFVTFNVIDIEGNRLQKTVNLDVVFRSEDALERHWLLLDDVWIIDDPVPHDVGGGGFQPVVDDWDEEHGEIEL